MTSIQPRSLEYRFQAANFICQEIPPEGGTPNTVLLHTCRCSQGVRLVGLFPGEAITRATEVAV
jgi:hypothetical protein